MPIHRMMSADLLSIPFATPFDSVLLAAAAARPQPPHGWSSLNDVG
jgi:hypothetical protein